MVTSKLRVYFVLLGLFGAKICFCQKNNEIPVYYYNHFNTFITSNPSAIIDTSTLEVGLFYNAFFGAFSKIRDFEAYGIYRPSLTNSWLVEANSDQEGPTFQKNRFYLGYYRKIALTPKVNTQFGAKLGIVNYYFQPSSSGTGGSDSGLDGTISLSVFTSKWLIGSAWQQFPSTELQPIDYVFYLSRYWEIHGYYLLEQPTYTIKFGSRNRISSVENTYQLSSDLQYLSLQVGASVSNFGYSLSAGYFGFLPRTRSKEMLISVLYFLPNTAKLIAVNQNRIEIICKLFIRK